MSSPVFKGVFVDGGDNFCQNVTEIVGIDFSGRGYGMEVWDVVIRLYPAYRLVVWLFYGVLCYGFLFKGVFEVFVVLASYLLVASLSFRIRNRYFEAIALAIDVALSFYFSLALHVPVLILFTLPPLFASLFLAGSFSWLILAEAIVADVFLVRPWYLAVVSHCSIFLASVLSFRRVEAERIRREKERLEREFREKLEIARRLSMEFAHEVRNPLMNISAAVQMIKRKGISEDAKKWFAVIEEEIRRASDLATEFLSLEGRKDTCEVIEVCAFLRELADAEVYSGKVEVFCEEPVFVFANRKELQKAFLNMLRNSFEAGADRVWFEVFKDDEEVVVRVRDNGSGIEPELWDRVFLPFFTTKPGGTGLGLAVVKSVVERHRGRVMITDKNTIEVRLPLSHV